MKRRGITFIEVVIAAAFTAIIVGAIGVAFSLTIRHEMNFRGPREDFESRLHLESRIKDLLSHVYLSSDSNDQETYLVAGNPSDLEVSSTTPGLTFTILGTRPLSAALENTTDEFDTRNQTYGPTGGLTEVSLSTTPVGDAGGLQGLFLRIQAPADEDTTQGGYETLLSEQVASIRFEFLDGTEWVTEWDTTIDRRLPAEIRVYYTVQNDPDTENIIDVRIPVELTEPQREQVPTP